MQIINWYPGHIAKAERKLKENSKLVDLVIEMVDSRLPYSSHFDFIDKIFFNKEKIIILNKSDLSEREKCNQALKFWQEKNVDAISLTTTDGKDILKLKGVLKRYHKKLTEKLAKRGVLPRSIRIMVVGIPNIGKSTLINRLVSKKSVKTGDKPGVTKSAQWVRIGENEELLDTPGIILPKFENQELALKLVMLGSISMEAYEPIETAREIINFMKRNNPGFLENLDNDFSLEVFGKKRNFLISGGNIDIERSARTFIKELRDGKLGIFSIE